MRRAIKVTFPGSAFEVSGRGEKSGSTAIWKIAQTENYNLIAKGADHASSRDSKDTDTNSSPLIIIIIVLMLTTIGGVAAFIIIRQKRTKAGAPGYPQPGQQPYAPQPGYGQPAQAPAPGAAPPGYYAQPGPQQPYNPQQGGASGYNPGGQY